MLAKQRLDYILKRLDQDAGLSVATLAKELHVSLSTLQRDLRELKKQGKIVREHGGALSNSFYETLTSTKEDSTQDKTKVNAKQKDAIAKQASKWIQEGDCIYLDTGTTMGYLLPYIMNKEITIVTNSYYLLQKAQGCKAKLMILGGQYNAKYEMSGGSMCLKEIDTFCFDACFISCNGIDNASGEVTCVESDNGIIKEHAIARSSNVYLLADDSKYSIRATYCFSNIKDYHKIFTKEKKARETKNENNR